MKKEEYGKEYRKRNMDLWSLLLETIAVKKVEKFFLKEINKVWMKYRVKINWPIYELWTKTSKKEDDVHLLPQFPHAGPTLFSRYWKTLKSFCDGFLSYGTESRGRSRVRNQDCVRELCALGQQKWNSVIKKKIILIQ